MLSNLKILLPLSLGALLSACSALSALPIDPVGDLKEKATSSVPGADMLGGDDAKDADKAAEGDEDGKEDEKSKKSDGKVAELAD